MGADARPPSSAPSRRHSAQTKRILARRAQTELGAGLGASLARRQWHCCKGFEPPAVGQTFRLNTSARPAFPLLSAFLCLFLAQSRYTLSASRWLERKTRGVSGSGARAASVLVCVISCRAALAPPVPAFLRGSTSLNCTSAPQLSLQCLATQGKLDPPMRRGSKPAPKCQPTLLRPLHQAESPLRTANAAL